MGNVTGTPEIIIAWWVAVATFGVSVVMLAAIVVLRQRALRRDRADAQARGYWSGVFQQVLAGAEVAAHAPVRRFQPGLLEAWNAVHESLDEVQARVLQPLARQIGLGGICRGFLDGSYHDRAMALVALGHQRDRDSFDVLVPFLRDPSPLVSLCAARALAQIDPPQAMALFVPMIVERGDWVPGNVARILSENRDGSAARELSGALLHANTDTAVRLVRFLADIDPVQAAGVIRGLLDAPVDDHVISVCLQVLRDPADRGRVRQLLAAPRWHVRMHAASALARIGDAGDSEHLEPLLADPVWWVRYRAAQAIAALPEVGSAGLARLRARQQDRYAQDIIDQVLAEKYVGVAA